MIAFGHQFDAVLGVKLEGLGDRRSRVVNAVRHRAGHREIRIDWKSPVTRVDSAVAVIDRIVEMFKTYVGCGQCALPNTQVRIAGANTNSR